MKRRPIGNILVEMGIIDEHQLQSALGHQRQWGMPLGRALIDKNFATSEQVLQALSKQTLMQAVDLTCQPLSGELARLLPRKCAEQHRAVPLRLEGARNEVLVVAIAAPASIDSLDAIKATSGKMRVVAYLADDASIERAFGVIYLGYDKAETAQVEAKTAAIHLEEAEFEFESNAVAAPVAEIVPAKLRPVLIYGWNEQAGKTLALILASEKIPARVATSAEVLGCAATDVIIAPLPAMEAILPRGEKAPGRLIVAGKVPENDLPRAQLLGARGFITAPVDTALLLRAVKRCRAIEEKGDTRAA